jgi:DNA-binding NarL/FixJ family response regulator
MKMKPKLIRILLADDNPALRSALSLMLETRLIAQVIGETDNMYDLLAGVRLSHPDVVILDWELPRTSKSGWIAAMHAVYPPLKIVVTSSQPEAAREAKAAFADAFVSKSESPEHLVRVLETLNLFGPSVYNGTNRCGSTPSHEFQK